MSNLMILGNAPLTMSSREIAELTGKEHFHVMRDIREMLAALAEDESKFGGIYLDAYGREQACFNLPKDLTITLVAGYNVQMRHAIVKRWQELEAKQSPAFAIPQTLPEALRLAADLSEQNERLALERDEAKRTKAQIGSKREATAMAAASAAVRKVNQLRQELGRNQQHATVIAVERATGRKFPKNAYVALRRVTKEYGLEAVSVMDPRWGTAKAWPAVAWREAFGIDLAALFSGAEAA